MVSIITQSIYNYLDHWNSIIALISDCFFFRENFGRMHVRLKLHQDQILLSCVLCYHHSEVYLSNVIKMQPSQIHPHPYFTVSHASTSYSCSTVHAHTSDLKYRTTREIKRVVIIIKILIRCKLRGPNRIMRTNEETLVTLHQVRERVNGYTT